MRCLHDVRLEAQHQHVIAVERIGLPHPRPVLRQQLRRQRRKYLERGQERGFLLDDSMDGEIADIEFAAHDQALPIYAAGGAEIFTDGRSSIF